MAEVQTVYSDSIVAGYPGMVANGETSNRISRTVEDAAGIAFGKAVFRGAGDQGVTATVGSGFLGFTIADAGTVALPGADADEYQQYASAPVITSGAVYVTAGENVTDGAQVYVDPDDKAIVDTATDNIIATGWVFDQTVSTGAVVRISKR
ncbi:MAG: structural cement protein Gp24 [Sphingobium sp.]